MPGPGELADGVSGGGDAWLLVARSWMLGTQCYAACFLTRDRCWAPPLWWPIWPYRVIILISLKEFIGWLM
ncbi:UNVERIFIED_CONTAM: hypothetical protein K2H54_016253 [Gekko kuhli]